MTRVIDSLVLGTGVGGGVAVAAGVAVGKGAGLSAGVAVGAVGDAEAVGVDRGVEVGVSVALSSEVWVGVGVEVGDGPRQDNPATRATDATMRAAASSFPKDTLTLDSTLAHRQVLDIGRTHGRRFPRVVASS